MPMRQSHAVPSRIEVKDHLTCLLNAIANIPVDRITDIATIDEQLQMNSVAFVELQVAIEDEYRIQIDPIRVVELNQFSAIVDYIYDEAVRAVI